MHNEVPELWGKSKYREFHVGHTHKVQTEEKNGVIVRTIPSIATKSSWEYNKAYTSIKGAKGFVWNKKEGLYSIIPINII